MTDKQKKLYDSWTKEQIYEAYLLEHYARVKLNKRINELEDKLSFIRYNLKKVAECVKVLKIHFKSA